jgi:hypothetical protein
MTVGESGLIAKDPTWVLGINPELISAQLPPPSVLL